MVPEPFYSDNLIEIWQGDCRRMDLPDKSVHVICTSPPYWGLRKYQGEVSMIWDGWTGELGREPTPELYLAHMVEICREFRRVLRDDGTMWLNCGDSMIGYKGNNYLVDKSSSNLQSQSPVPASHSVGTPQSSQLKQLNLMGIPWRLALALQADGWILRCDGIWKKDNPMPESISGTRWEKHRTLQWPDGSPYNRVKDQERPQEVTWQDCPGCAKCLPNDGLVLRRGAWRPTKSHEYIFQFTKTDRYYSDQEAVREANHPDGRKVTTTHSDKYQSIGLQSPGERERWPNPAGRNIRSVWTFPTQPFRGFGKLDYFATFPEALPERCIKASTSEWGVCPKCGSQWARVITKGELVADAPGYKPRGRNKPELGVKTALTPAGTEQGHPNFHYEQQTVGWRATCSCNAGNAVPALVLDPFLGSGTTLWVCKKLGRRGVGYDLSMDYVKLSLERNRQMGLG